MADEARVKSVEALEYFRSSLIVFNSKARKAVAHAEDSVKRGRYWMEQEMHTHWTQEFKKRSRKLAQAQAELLTAKLSKYKDSVMLQEKLMRRAKEELTEAETKLRNIKRWAREFDRIYDPAMKGLGHLGEYLEHDMPRAVAWMDQALKALSAYLERERPPGSAPAPPADAENPMDSTPPAA
jgi:hypothetical protein